MNEIDKESHLHKSYPCYIIILRWMILSTIFIFGLYIIYHLNQMLALLYILYSVFALTLILPLVRCVHCYYYGKWCNTAWGKITAYLYKKGDQEKYVSTYPFAVLLYPLWLFPLLVGVVQLLRGRDLASLIFLLIYISLLLFEKSVFRFVACPNCHQKEFCPAFSGRRKDRGGEDK